MNRTEKQQLVTELTDRIKGAKALYYTDFTGLNVKRMTELRRRLRKAGVEYVVIKNTLALRAINDGGLTGTRLRGPTGVVVSKDPIAAAKLLTDFAKENDQKPVVKGGLLEGAIIDQAHARGARRRAAVAHGRLRRRDERIDVHDGRRPRGAADAEGRRVRVNPGA